jgi:hypothetical protein
MNADSKQPVHDIKALEGARKPPLNWDGGKREIPSNRGKGDPSSATREEYPNGDRGEATARNLEQQAAVSGTPDKSTGSR